jgi:uncharacterized membrane protein YfcA
VGAKVLATARNQTLRLVFAAVIGVMAVQMIYKGIAGRL